MVITILTDFGESDSYVAQMKGVIYGINPDVKVVDITHKIPPGDIKIAGFRLWTAYKYFPKGSIHLVVVDPGVGTERKPIIVRTEKYFFVGPDNGVFSYIYENEKCTVYKIRDIPDKISNTFHGRDVFAPCAGKLSLRISPGEIGKRIVKFIRFSVPKPEIRDKEIIGEVIDIDRFGNLITNIPESILKSSQIEVRFKERVIKGIQKAYKGGSPIAIIGSSGLLEISLPSNSCKDFFGAKEGEKVTIHLTGEL